MKRLALAVLMLLVPCMALAQQPIEVVNWVLDQYPPLERPNTIEFVYPTQEEWEALMVSENLHPQTAAYTDLDDFREGTLKITLHPNAKYDFFLIHETLHWVESALHEHKLPQVSHSENVVTARQITIMCGGSHYRDWKFAHEEGWPFLPTGAFCGPDGGIYTIGQ
jgi:hypothetical protein